MFTNELIERLETERIIAVTTIDDERDAVPLARALLAGGVRTIELTLRTPAAWESVRNIRRTVPEMAVGVGTILTVEQCRRATDEGAAFGVAPGLNPDVVAGAEKVGLPFAPGVATASEVERALSLGCTVLKFFPSEPLGGLEYLRSLNGPYNHLALRYIPLGGVNDDNLDEYLAAEEVLAVGGSWIAARALIREKAWDGIRGNAESATRRVRRSVGER